jgi:hypothetical protein
MSTLGGVRGGDREESPYSIAKKMDPRVEPAGDAERCVIAEFLQFMTQWY